MREKTCGVEPCARKIINVAISGSILILALGKLSMAEVWEKIEPSGSPPSGRNGHVLISPGGPEQFIFGGFGQNNDLWMLRQEGETWRWEYRVAQGTAAPTARGGHSGAFVDQAIIIFGGSASPLSIPVDSETYKLSNPWDPSSVWQKLETTGTAPSPRAEHTAVYETSMKWMFVFGGYTDGVEASSETYSLDLSTSPASWTKLNGGGKIPARYGHSAVWGGMGMMVFGGKDTSGKVLNDCWYYPGAWTEMNIAGDKPPARWQHTAVWMWGGPMEPDKMLIFGGQDENGTPLDDIWVLQQPGPGVPNWKWERIYPIGDLPSKRSGHTASTIWLDGVEQGMLVFGGVAGSANFSDFYIFSEAEEVEKVLQEKPFNAPNPFNPYEGETKICYYLDRDDDNVTIKLFTLTGDLVYSWENISGRQGLNQWPWNGRNEKGKIVENGGYICLIEGAGKKQKCKIAVLK